MSFNTKKDKLRKDVGEFDTAIRAIRAQEQSQITCMTTRMDSKLALLDDMSDFLKRRGEIEGEYGRSLTRLADRCMEKVKTGNYPSNRQESTCNVWLKLLFETKRRGQDHSRISSYLGCELIQHFAALAGEVEAMNRRSTDILQTLQTELNQTILELETCMNQYHATFKEQLDSKGKMEKSLKESQRQTKFLKTQKEEKVEKRVKDFDTSTQRATMARNKYIVHLASFNEAMKKYYDDFVPSIVRVGELCWQDQYKWCVNQFTSSLTQLEEAALTYHKDVTESVNQVIPESDTGMFLDFNKSHFTSPMQFEQLMYPGDTQCLLQKEEYDLCHKDLSSKLEQLTASITELKTSINEDARTRDTASDMLLSLRATNHEALQINLFAKRGSTEDKESTVDPKKGPNIIEMTAYYCQKCQEIIIKQLACSGFESEAQQYQIAMDTRPPEEPLIRTLSADCTYNRTTSLTHEDSLKNKVNRASLLITDETVPLVIRSCINFVGRYGSYSEGIYRVPGSQSKIDEIREGFNKGTNILETLSEKMARDSVYAVAGYLKCFLRENLQLSFPPDLYDSFMAIAAPENADSRIERLQDILSCLPPLNHAVVHNLFHHLHQMASHSEHTKMHSHNLAVVFGPTLLHHTSMLKMAPGVNMLDPASLGPQLTAANNANSLIEIIIQNTPKLFPVTKKSIEEELDTQITDLSSSPTHPHSSPSSTHSNTKRLSYDNIRHISNGSADDSSGERSPPQLRGRAIYSYEATSRKELSLIEGEEILLFSRANAHWWEACVRGKEGYVPAQYCALLDNKGNIVEVPDWADEPEGEQMDLSERDDNVF